MNNQLSAKERAHIARVKELPCSLCSMAAPSEAHHISQKLQFCVVALCPDCHRGVNGWHGNKSLWRIYKHDELSALNVTLSRLMGVK